MQRRLGVDCLVNNQDLFWVAGFAAAASAEGTRTDWV